MYDIIWEESVWLKTFRFSLTIEVITFKEVVIKAKKSLFSLFKNDRGFSLPEVLIAAGILGGVAVGMMALMKQQTDQSIEGKVQADLAQAKAEIIAAITTPANCNANFYSKTISGFTMSDIKTCNGSACGSGGGTGVTKIATVSTSGSPEVWTGTGISERVKLVSITPTIAPVTLVSPATRALTTVTLDLVFRHKQTGNRPPKNLPSMKFTTVVVANTTTILGCPKSWNSTVVY